MDLELFGTPAYPLRASALPQLVRCPWNAVMRFAELYPDNSSAAADTGSAVHVAVAAWHKKQDYAGAVKAMKEGLAGYPLADFHEAELHFRPYSEDPRNQKAEIVHIEQPVEFDLAPAEEDPTQKPIRVRGTLDQVRREAGRLRVWDVKTGSPEGWDMLHGYFYQLAAYAVGAQCDPGGVIRTRGYRKRGKLPPDPPGVFWHYAHTLADCDAVLDAVRSAVARVRAGRVHVGPGEHCRYCPAGGVDQCVPKLLSLRVL